MPRFYFIVLLLLSVWPTPTQAQSTIRPAYAAGIFYDKDTESLKKNISEKMSKAKDYQIKKVRALLVPHASLYFSGQIAAEAFKEVSPNFKRVFLIASNHNNKARFSGVSIPRVTHYSIPNYRIPVSKIILDLFKEKLFSTHAEAHTMHMLEVELPFLQHIKNWPKTPDYTIIPMILGRMNNHMTEQLAEQLKRYATPDTLFIFSVDLSHYHPYQTALKYDWNSIDAVMAQDKNKTKKLVTDGNQVLTTMVKLAQKMGWDSTFLDYKNSGDVSGKKNAVVGYAAIAYHEPFSLTQEEQKDILRFVRESIQYNLDHNLPAPDLNSLAHQHPLLMARRSSFVTLKKNGKLRGCMGDHGSQWPLLQSLHTGSIHASTKDRRFKPVTLEEMKDIHLSVSVLGYPQLVQLKNPNDLLKAFQDKKDGAVLHYKGRSSLYLPSVWEQLPTPELFFDQLCKKQGSPKGCWRDPTAKVFRYRAFVFEE